MERLTTNKDVSEMGMFELAHNSCYSKDGKARYRDYDIDMDARELTRKLLVDYAEGDDAFTCDEDFDDWIMECLAEGMNSIEGFIALFYRNLWAMADLYERLKKYEDLEEQNNGGWIPCSERLPEKSGKYLVTYRDELVDNYVIERNFYNGKFEPMPYSEKHTGRKALAWQPLPQPYKVTEEIIKLPCKVGDTVYLKAACECINTIMDIEGGLVECPFECDCEFEKCNSDNERIFKTTIESIFNNGHGWYCSLNHIYIEISIRDFGKTVFLTWQEAENILKEKEE